MPSFDIVSTFNIQEVDNAVNITAREVVTRYDLKDQNCIISSSTFTSFLASILVCKILNLNS